MTPLNKVTIVAFLAWFTLLSPSALPAQEHRIDILDTQDDPRDPAGPLAELVLPDGLLVHYPADEAYDLPQQLKYYDGKEVHTIEIDTHRDLKLERPFRDGVVISSTYFLFTNFIYLDLKRQRLHTFLQDAAYYVAAPIYHRDKVIYRGKDDRIYLTDGTAEHTQVLDSVGIVSGNRLEARFTLGDKIYISNNRMAFVTDGTPTGTHLLPRNRYVSESKVFGDRIITRFYGSVRAWEGYGVDTFTSIVFPAVEELRDEIPAQKGIVYFGDSTIAHKVAYATDGTLEGTHRLFSQDAFYREFRYVKMQDRVIVLARRTSSDQEIDLYQTDGSPEGTVRINDRPLSTFSLDTRYLDDSNRHGVFVISGRVYGYSPEGGLRTLGISSLQIGDQDDWLPPAAGMLLQFQSSSDLERVRGRRIDLRNGAVESFDLSVPYTLYHSARAAGNKLLVHGSHRSSVSGDLEDLIVLFDPVTLTVDGHRQVGDYAFANETVTPDTFPTTADGRVLFISDDHHRGHSVMEANLVTGRVWPVGDLHPYTQSAPFVKDLNWRELTAGDRLFFRGDRRNQLLTYRTGQTSFDTVVPDYVLEREDLMYLGTDRIVSRFDEGLGDKIIQSIDLESGEVTTFPIGNYMGAFFGFIGDRLWKFAYTDRQTEDREEYTNLSVTSYDLRTGTAENHAQQRMSGYDLIRGFHLVQGGLRMRWAASINDEFYFTWFNEQGDLTLHRMDAQSGKPQQVMELDYHAYTSSYFPTRRSAGDAFFVAMDNTEEKRDTTHFYLIDPANGVSRKVVSEFPGIVHDMRGISDVASLSDHWILQTADHTYSIDKGTYSVETLSSDGDLGNHPWDANRKVAHSESTAAFLRRVDSDGREELVVSDGTLAGTRIVSLPNNGSVHDYAVQGTQVLISYQWFNRNAGDIVRESRLGIYDLQRESLDTVNLSAVNSSNPGHVYAYDGGFAFDAFNYVYGREPHLLNVTGVNPILSSHPAAPNGEAKQLHVFPNPTSGTLDVLLENAAPYRFTVYDLRGRQFPTVRLADDRLDLSRLPRGVYLLVADGPDGRSVARIIRQ